MPPTSAESTRLACALVDAAFSPDALESVQWQDGTPISPQELRDVLALAIYEMRLRRERRPKAQRRALRLLRRHLSAEQKRQLRVAKCFTLRAASGRLYRLSPAQGKTEQVERHGTRLYATGYYCLHDAEETLPKADVTLAHLLLLSSDEPAFLAAANWHKDRTTLWSGEWRRTLNQARREREAASAEVVS